MGQGNARPEIPWLWGVPFIAVRVSGMAPKKKKAADTPAPRDTAQAEAMPNFELSLTEEAGQDLAQISDTATREAIVRRALELQHEPLKLGKALTGDLKNYRSLRAAGQRYRIVYQVAMDAETRAVVVVVIGIRKDGDRKDAYAVAGRRLG